MHQRLSVTFQASSNVRKGTSPQRSLLAFRLFNFFRYKWSLLDFSEGVLPKIPQVLICLAKHECCKDLPLNLSDLGVIIF